MPDIMLRIILKYVAVKDCTLLRLIGFFSFKMNRDLAEESSEPILLINAAFQVNNRHSLFSHNRNEGFFINKLFP